MKLIFCPKCHDVFRLRGSIRKCDCGLSWGRYTDEINAEIGGMAIPLGFTNDSFVRAIQERPKEGYGSRYVAFVIPEKCETIKFCK